MARDLSKVAALLREPTPTPASKTLEKALAVFTEYDIPHFVCGGYTVQEYGYARTSPNIDLIVPDLGLPLEKLRDAGFKSGKSQLAVVTDLDTKVEVSLHQGGERLHQAHTAEFPIPVLISVKPAFLDLNKLISLKMVMYEAYGIKKIQHYADIVGLILANRLPRSFHVDSPVKNAFLDLWDEIHRN
jgi:hypothetical protein